MSSTPKRGNYWFNHPKENKAIYHKSRNVIVDMANKFNTEIVIFDDCAFPIQTINKGK